MTRLEQLRLDAHMSVGDLAKAANVGHQTILDIEATRRRPHIKTLAKLSTYFGEPASALIGPAHVERAA